MSVNDEITYAIDEVLNHPVRWRHELYGVTFRRWSEPRLSGWDKQLQVRNSIAPEEWTSISYDALYDRISDARRILYPLGVPEPLGFCEPTPAQLQGDMQRLRRPKLAAAIENDDPAYVLAMLVLQSELYALQHDVRDAVDNVLATFMETTKA